MKQRNTLQKSLILEAAKSLHHPTAEDIYQKIAVDYPTISRGTVYRNLGFLAGQGTLRKVAVPDAADRFDSTLAEHYHIRCRSCGRVADVHLPYQRMLICNITDTDGFLIEEHDIVFRGLCPDCLTENTPSPV